MKFVFILLTATALHTVTEAQSQGITLSLKNASLETAFKSIEQQSSYSFVYSNEAMALSKPVSVEVKNETIDNVLKLCFSGQPLGYTVDEKLIIVKVAEKQTEKPPVPLVVQGIITNENGDPLNGASIRLKGTEFGAIANEKGEFSLEGVSRNSIMGISSVGYETVEVPLKGRLSINVKLKTSINNLDETLVIGYGNTTQRYTTGSICKVAE